VILELILGTIISTGISKNSQSLSGKGFASYSSYKKILHSNAGQSAFELVAVNLYQVGKARIVTVRYIV